MNRWGLVTAWAVEHDDGRGGRMITSKTHEAGARELLARMAPENAEELTLWSPRGIEQRIEAVCERCVGLGYSFVECHRRKALDGVI